VQSIQLTGRDTSGYSDVDYKFSYPLINLHDKSIEQSINLAVMTEVFYIDSFTGTDSNDVIAYMFDELENHIVEMSFTDFEVRGSILLFRINCGYSGAYYHEETNYFAFNLNSGKRYCIRDLVKNKKLDEWKTIISRDMRYSYNDNLSAISNDVERAGRDSSELNIAFDLTQNCFESLYNYEWLKSNDFYFENNTLVIPSFCEFPHVVSSLAPYKALRYDASYIRHLLVSEISKALKFRQ